MDEAGDSLWRPGLNIRVNVEKQPIPYESEVRKIDDEADIIVAEC